MEDTALNQHAHMFRSFRRQATRYVGRQVSRQTHLDVYMFVCPKGFKRCFDLPSETQIASFRNRVIPPWNSETHKPSALPLALQAQ